MRLKGPATILFMLVAVAILVAILAVGVSAATLPGCTLCHNQKTFAAQTAELPHSQVACSQCHVGPGVASRVSFATTQVFGMTLRITPVDARATASVDDATCLACHRAVMDKVISARGYMIDHETCAVDARCTDCHSTVAHGTASTWPRIPQMDDCLRCHATDEVYRSCDTCHDEKAPKERLGYGAWTTTHGPSWQTTHGMGNTKTCAACHAEDYCVRCHEIPLPHSSQYIRSHSTDALEQPNACKTCHQTTFCKDCHGFDMPHARDFTKGHSKLIEAQGDEACYTCHVKSDCSGCHVKHVHPGGSKPVKPSDLTSGGAN